MSLLNENQDLKSGEASYELKLNKHFLANVSGSTLKVQFYLSSDPRNFVSLIIYVNEYPKIQSCLLSGYYGVSMKDEIEISCEGISDSDGFVKLYEYLSKLIYL